MVRSSGFGVEGAGFRVQGSGFRVQGSGSGVRVGGSVRGGARPGLDALAHVHVVEHYLPVSPGTAHRERERVGE